MTWRILIAIIAGATGTQSQATMRIEQTVQLQSGAQTAQEKHEWLIDPGRFRLNVSLSGREVSYIFTGQNFVACIRATDPEAMSHQDVLKAHPKLAESMKKGLCVTAPINVVTSFFLSPHNFVSALDVTDSLQLRLTLKKYEAETGKSESVLNQNCIQRKNQFTYEYFAYMSNKELENSATESGCYVEGITWRKALWQQLSKTLLQQKSGRELRKLLASYQLEDSGFPMTKTSTYTINDDGKPIRTVKVAVSTDKVETITAPDRFFFPPAGFDILSSVRDWRHTTTQATMPATKEDTATVGKSKAKAAASDDSPNMSVFLWFLGMAL